MTINEIPTSVIIFVIGQTATAAWAIITTHFKVLSIEKQVVEMKAESEALQKQLRELNDTLLLVKHSVDLLVIGRLKTGTLKN